MWKCATLVIMVATMTACETRTTTEEIDRAPTAGMSMSPANAKQPAGPMENVTSPSNQIPSNGPR